MNRLPAIVSTEMHLTSRERITSVSLAMVMGEGCESAVCSLCHRDISYCFNGNTTRLRHYSLLILKRLLKKRAC